MRVIAIKNSYRSSVICFILYASVLCTALSNPLDTAAERVIKNATDNALSQQKIDQLDDETRQLFSEYRALLQKNRQLEDYLAQLRVLLEDQDREIIRKEKEIVGVKGFEREVLPLLSRMITVLSEVIKTDMPFLQDERNQRVEKLNQMMTKSNVNAMEKFRRVFEAYQVESDYGNNIETYRGRVSTPSSEDKVVDFLRVGRSILIYRTLDGAERAVWDTQEQRWQRLDDYRVQVREAILIAQKRAAPNLLMLPVQAAPLITSKP